MLFTVRISKNNFKSFSFFMRFRYFKDVIRIAEQLKKKKKKVEIFIKTMKEKLKLLKETSHSFANIF